MTQDELKRYRRIMNHIQGLITAREAALKLDLSTRQVFRLKKRILEEGETGIIHKNRGRKPAHALSNEIREYIRNLLTSERYRNRTPRSFHAKMGLSIDRATVFHALGRYFAIT